MRMFLVWKDKDCNGIDPEWIEMTGKEFYRFTSRPENAGRRFIVLDDRFNEGADIITIEANEEEYQKWKKEYDHQRYLDKLELERETVSLYDAISMHEDLSYEEVIADEDINVEETIIQQVTNNSFRIVLSQLDKQEQKMVEFLFVTNRSLTESQMSAKYGIPQTTLNSKKLAIRRKLRALLEKSGIIL